MRDRDIGRRSRAGWGGRPLGRLAGVRRRFPRRRDESRDRQTIVCPCHDATLQDLRSQWTAGYSHAETLKRATAAYMGSCQGKFCAPLVAAVISELEGHAWHDDRRPTVRAPLFPVRMGDLVDEPNGADECP